ncbi:MAG: FliI/YscN family ATPase [Pseudomonadota bacterium]
MKQSLDLLSAVVRRHAPVHRVGRVTSISSATIVVEGLSDVASVGHRVGVGAGNDLHGEVVQVGSETITVLCDGDLSGVTIGDAIRHVGETQIYPSEAWLGRLIDGNGAPLDGEALVQGRTGFAIDAKPISAASRRSMGARLSTGYAVFDTMIPIVRGQRIGVFSGSGVGKSSLMAAFARNMEADVVVIALIGERGREVAHFVNNVLGPKGLKRSIVVASTSDQSPLMRRRAAFTAMTVAEYFRKSGRHVLLMVDSVTRLAEAHREIAAASGEAMSMRGFPASMTGLLAGFSERAGPGSGAESDITAVFTVLVSGSDMEEPVADTLRGLLDGHVVLSRDIAERGRFPAVDILQSVSRSLPEAATKEENEVIAQGRRVLSIYEESEIMLRSGLYQAGSNPQLDEAVALQPKLDLFASARVNTVEEGFDKLKTALSADAPD